MYRDSPAGGTIDHDRDTEGMNRQPLRRRRAGAATTGLAALALIATACGGGPKTPGVATAGGTTTARVAASGSSGSPGSTATARPASSAGSSSSSGSSGQGSSKEASQSLPLQFAQCMRSHRVPAFPDPSPGGGFLNAISASGINTHLPTFEAAMHACKKYNPAGDMTPAQTTS